MLILILLVVTSLLSSSSGLAPAGPWDPFNYAPQSRTVRPRSVRETVGSVRGAQNLVSQKGEATLSGNGSWLTVDFGIEVSRCCDRILNFS